jgi:hypothetical protein
LPGELLPHGLWSCVHQNVVRAVTGFVATKCLFSFRFPVPVFSWPAGFDFERRRRGNKQQSALAVSSLSFSNLSSIKPWSVLLLSATNSTHQPLGATYKCRFGCLERHL